MIFNIVEKMDDEFEVSDFPTISAEDRDHDRRLNFMIVENWQRTKSVVKKLKNFSTDLNLGWLINSIKIFGYFLWKKKIFL
jgi:hypothetical protein